MITERPCIVGRLSVIDQHLDAKVPRTFDHLGMCAEHARHEVVVLGEDDFERGTYQVCGTHLAAMRLRLASHTSWRSMHVRFMPAETYLIHEEPY